MPEPKHISFAITLGQILHLMHHILLQLASHVLGSVAYELLKLENSKNCAYKVDHEHPHIYSKVCLFTVTI